MVTRRGILQAAALSASSGAFAKLPAGGSVPRRTLGKTGESVSMVGLGGYHLGLARDEDESDRIVRMALDSGINFLDNCWDYNDGESESRMGRALRDGYRKKAFLMTKLDGRSAQAATAQLEQSLKRLQTDAIDLVQIHEVIRMEDAERVFAKGGAIEALVAARKAGKLRYIGFTGHKSPDIHLHMLETARKNNFAFDTVQMPLNAMDPHFRSFEKKVLPVLVERRIGVLGMKPMGAGLLLESGAVKAPECLRYSMSLPISVVVTGCDSLPVLRQALSVAMKFKPLKPDEKKALLARTAKAGANGEYEKFKTTTTFDGTAQHPWWLTEARL
jgi:aryl-alcohol dehydrogenase-like predicted oxidoreductase